MMRTLPIRTGAQLGVAVRDRRREMNLTQADLAERLHARQATISALEGGAVNTKLNTLLEALAALDLELAIRPRSRPATALDDLF